MKNIHVLPTDKPTWLHKSTLTGVLRKSSSCIDDMKQAQGMNIYITSNEEIEEGDWFLDDNNSIGQSYKLSHVQFANPKKIILTTDQDLIKDGVQAIDDEFLEWFVKNTSCEEVVIEDYGNLYNFRYLILIPKEEEVKEETLEEAALKYASEKLRRILIPYKEFNANVAEYVGFTNGAKWQQEITYSEEDLKEAFSMGRTGKTIEEFNIKFKNK